MDSADRVIVRRKKKLAVFACKLSNPTWLPLHPNPFALPLVVSLALPAKWPASPQARPATLCLLRRAPASPARFHVGQQHSRSFSKIRRLVLHISSDTFSFFFWFLSRAPHHLQSVRGVKTLDFAGSQEVVYERSDWPLAKLQDYFKNDTLALIGYGSQGHGQGLNARDNGLKVIVGVRENGESWKQALEDGWVRAYAQNFPRCL
jgi:hypothetical protein